MKHLARILLILILSLSAHALSQQEIQQIVKNNPGLASSPQARALLSQHKGTLGANTQAAKKNKIVAPTTPEVDTKPLETIKTDDTLLTKKVKEATTSDKNSLRLTPLQYKSTNEEINRIKSQQTPRIHHKKLERFSKEFFRNKNKISQKNITVPKDYTLARGDTLKFWIYGKTEKNFVLTINNVGNIDIPQVGPVRVAGEKFDEVKELLSNYLTSSYKNSSVVINLETFSNAQVTLTGFVNTPGIYNTTTVSSVKDILIEANGVGQVGSVRNIQILRDGSVINTIDYYHLLTQGLEHGDVVLKPNDTIHIPRAYGLVSIEGAVYKEAIYEIEAGESLAHILKFAGGLRAAADGYSIRVKRYSKNAKIQNLTLTIAEARKFRLQDGDEIYVDGLNVTNDQYVLVMGNIIREGKREMKTRGMQLSDLLRREIKNGKLDSFFLENTRFDYAMIKRIGADMQAEVYNVNLQSVLDGQSDFRLQNKDELYIFNKLDVGTAPYVNILGKPLIAEGKYLFHKGMTITDLINQAGIKFDYDKSKVKLVSKQDAQGKSEVIMIDMKNDSDHLLKEQDTLTLFKLEDTHPLDVATISGEVVKPGKYAVSQGMTLQSFIESAGGLNEKAYEKECEIIRYHIEDGERKKEILTVSLNEASSFTIKKHDVINIRRIPSWNDRRSITITGEVKFPGTYAIHSGEKLSSVIARAGGYTENAFLYGAVFTRKSVQALQKESLQRELARLKERVVLVNIRKSQDTRRQPTDISGIIAAVDSLVAAASKVTPKGRITIALQDDLTAFEHSSSNLTLKDKDHLEVPALNDTIVVNGEVMAPTALTYQGEDIESYIARSGGITNFADTEHIYVVHANGEAHKATLGSFLFSSANVDIRKGDVITVPKLFYVDQQNMNLIKDIADIFYKLSLTVAAAHTVGAF